MTLGRSLLLLKPRMRHVHAHLVTMPQSGTHWLCYMLALALSRTFDVPGPAHIADRQQSLRSELLFRNLREAIVSQDEKKRPAARFDIAFSNDLRERMPSSAAMIGRDSADSRPPRHG